MNSVLLLLDMQNDVVGESGAFAKSPLGEQVRQRQVVRNAREAVRKARAAGLAIGFVRVGFPPGYAAWPEKSPVFGAAKANRFFEVGTPGCEIHPDLGMLETDWLITKRRVSPFYATDLEVHLRTAKIGRIYFGGVSTQAVVQAAARDGHDRDFEMILLEDCCAAHSPEEHANSIGSLRGRFCQVTSAQEATFAS